MAQYKLCNAGVIDMSRGASIPADFANRDWQDFLAWQAAGGVPDPADHDPIPDTPAQQANQQLMNDPAFRGLVKVLAAQFSMTVPQLVAAIKAAA